MLMLTEGLGVNRSLFASVHVRCHSNLQFPHWDVFILMDRVQVKADGWNDSLHTSER